MSLFCLPDKVYAGATDTLSFSDNFDSLTSGSLSGQNGWTTASGAWTVTATTTGKNIVGNSSSYNTSVISQTGYSLKDSRLMVDFLVEAGHPGVHNWLRRTGTASTAAGYDLFYYSDGKLYLDYINGAAITGFNSVSFSATAGTWYTLEFEAINDGSGNPVLKGWMYQQGTSRPGSPNITYTDTAKSQANAGYAGIGGISYAVTADNVLLYSGDAAPPTAPNTPTSFAAVATSTEVALSWTAPSNGGSAITDYLVEYRTGGNSFATWNDGVGTSTSTTITGLATSTAYDFKVYAINAIGTSTAATVSATTTSGTAPSTPTLLSHIGAHASGGGGITSGSIDSTGATLLVATVSVVAQSAAGVTVSDSNGNTWHALTDRAGSANIHTAIWYAYDKAGSSLVTSPNNTVTIAGTNIYPSVSFSAWAGTLTSSDPFDVQNGSGGNGVSISTNNVTPSQNNELVITSFGSDTSGTYTVGSSFTVLDTSNFSSGSNMGNSSAYYIQNSASTTGPTWSTTGSGNIATGIATFKARNSGATAPDAPTSFSGTAGLQQVALSWTAPSNGGSAITDYLVEYRTGGNSFATWNDGVGTSTSTTITGLATSTAYDFKVYAINAIGTSTAATVSATTTSSYITITSPLRSVSASSTVATIAIPRSECSTTFYIPYIQTSSTLSVSTSVDSSGLPIGGGVKFVLTDSHSNTTTLYDMSAPFAVSFTNLEKDEYTLDTYIVDSSQVVQSGVAYHDTATNIGIGDIYVAIGDSVTEGYDGTAYNVSPYTDWTQAPVKSTDNRNYPQCGISSGFYQDHWQEVSHHISLNNTLESYNDYPVFFLNEGVAGITSSGYITKMNTSAWQTPVTTLSPNKWLLHLGTNDGGGSSGFKNNMQSIIDTLGVTYGASGRDIILAVPSKYNNWQPYINDLITDNDLTAGPNFTTYYTNHPATYSSPHPTVSGHVQMSRMWGISIIMPKNILATEASSTINLSWDTLSGVEPTIVGYKVYYGTSSTTLNNTLDVGSNSSTTISSGLTNGQTYYFAVQGYDDDAYSLNLTATSSIVSINYVGDTTPPVISSVATSTTDSASQGPSAGGGGFVSANGITNNTNTNTTTNNNGVGKPITNTGLPTNFTFKKNADTGTRNTEVLNLQKFLNTQGYKVSTKGAGSPGKETLLFGPATRAALARFQKANGIKPAVGYFGPLTRAYINSLIKSGVVGR